MRVLVGCWVVRVHHGAEVGGEGDVGEGCVGEDDTDTDDSDDNGVDDDYDDVDDTDDGDDTDTDDGDDDSDVYVDVDYEPGCNGHTFHFVHMIHQKMYKI